MLLLVFLAFICRALAIATIEAKGSKLFADGSQFYIKGEAHALPRSRQLTNLWSLPEITS